MLCGAEMHCGPHHAPQDYLGDPTDVAWLITQLPKETVVYVNLQPDYSHMQAGERRRAVVHLPLTVNVRYSSRGETTRMRSSIRKLWSCSRSTPRA